MNYRTIRSKPLYGEAIIAVTECSHRQHAVQKVMWFHLLIFTVTIFSSCSKNWLDKRSNITLAVPKSVIDFQAMLDNVDGLMNVNSPSFSLLAADEYYVSDDYFNSSMSVLDKNAYTWSRLNPFIDVIDWIYLYKRVFNCNVVLEGVEKNMSEENLNEWNNIKGQALFHRARSFFEIAQVWAPQPSTDNMKSNLGIPLRLSSDVNLASNRSTIKDTYGQILNDLLQASTLLPMSGLYKTRATKVSTFAMLTRVNLVLGNYNEALRFSDSTLKYNSKLIDFNFLDSLLDYPLPRLDSNQEVILHSSIIGSGTMFGNAFIIPDFYDSFNDNDLRKSMFFKKSEDGLIFFRGGYDGSIILFNGLATNEIFLIKAECLVRNQKIQEGLDVLNALLISRWKTGTFVPYELNSEEEVLKIIFQERRKELQYRGLIWSDFKRLNQDPRFKRTLTRIVDGKIYNLEPMSEKSVFPLPEDVIRLTAMNQNPGWGL